MAFFYRWLPVLMVAVIGCSGHPDDEGAEEDSGAVDGGRDRDAYTNDGVGARDGDTTSSDGAADSRDVLVVDNAVGGRDGQLDARDAGSAADTRDAGSAADTSDSRVPDGRADAVDARADGVDAGADSVADIRDGNIGEVDVFIDTPSGADARDAASEPPVDDGFDDARISDADAGSNCTPVTCNLVSLAVTPALPSISPHSTTWIRAIGFYADNSMRDLSKDALWSSANASVHVSNAVGNEGLVTARITGTSVVSAKVGVLEAATTVVVLTADPAVLRLTPSVASIASGTAQPLKATVIFSDMSSWADWTSMMQWSSSSPSVATVADGIVTGVAPGTTTITATFSWVTASAQLTITPAILSSLSVEPAALTLPIGPIHPLRATGHFSDGTTQDLTAQAVWGSSNTSRATVGDLLGSKGKVSGISAGSATISASFGGIGASAAIDVSTAVLQSIGVLYPPAGRLMMFMDLPMAASGTYSDGSSFDITGQTTWTSSNASIIEVSGRTITGVGEGYANVDALAGGVSQRLFLEVRAGELGSIAISPSPASVVRGASIFFHATGAYSGGSTYDLTWFLPWNTVDPNVAFIADPERGGPPKLTGVNAGTTNVTASWAGVGASSVVDVTTMR